ncbi:MULTISPECIES: PEP-utilizing enzyme [unclassified Pseudonocardia]|uniref:PEP-utilizing enzyme n=1 Tax=unclassified Pseudonocardia TaxID=2619320 RepID=UPI0001FFE701|nr:PEP-utilizing enzyme [Pseudonocardia sp. Ae707_Ps1]OLM18236.1 Phosphoenolpyruvate synthase [Pseudonocardia sp. Ae707_Ps1]
MSGPAGASPPDSVTARAPDRPVPATSASAREGTTLWRSDLLSDWARFPLTPLARTMGPIATADAAWSELADTTTGRPAVVVRDGQAWLDADVAGPRRAGRPVTDGLRSLHTEVDAVRERLPRIGRSAQRSGPTANRCRDLLVETVALSAPAVRALAHAEYRLLAAGSPAPQVDESLVGGRSCRLLDALWEVSRVVARSSDGALLLGRGLPGLGGRLGTGHPGSAREVFRAVRSLLDHHGHLGAAPWDLGVPSWRSDPSGILALIDRLRTVPDDHPPPVVRRPSTPPAAAGELGGWATLRADAMDTVSRIVAVQRTIVRQAGRALQEDGLLFDAAHVAMLDGDELVGCVPEDVSLRTYDHNALDLWLPPREIVGPVPAAVRWIHARDVPRLGPGEVVHGSGTGGRVRGRATVLRSPAGASRVRPGDVVVVASGGAEWLTAVLLAGAVVVDAGMSGSPLAALCRMSAVPCVTGTETATARIRGGDDLVVDGALGTVTRGRG